jgi:hypothetical protein
MRGQFVEQKHMLGSSLRREKFTIVRGMILVTLFCALKSDLDVQQTNLLLITIIVVNLVTLKAAAKLELLLNKPASWIGILKFYVRLKQ